MCYSVHGHVSNSTRMLEKWQKNIFFSQIAFVLVCKYCVSKLIPKIVRPLICMSSQNLIDYVGWNYFNKKMKYLSMNGNEVFNSKKVHSQVFTLSPCEALATNLSQLQSTSNAMSLISSSLRQTLLVLLGIQAEQIDPAKQSTCVYHLHVWNFGFDRILSAHDAIGICEPLKQGDTVEFLLHYVTSS